jgi:alpha-ketoglutarate-dependent taurine dioxygenase
MSDEVTGCRNVRKMPAVKRKPIGGSGGDLITERIAREGATLPLLFQPSADGLDLAEWSVSNLPLLEERLYRHGAVLFRSFHVRDISDFNRTISAISGDAVKYQEHTSPRSHVQGGIYTSTEYPAEQAIFLHNENSYQQTWPMKFFLFCERPALSGGATPLADCRRVFENIDPEIRDLCIRKQWILIRNFGDGFGLTWQDAFYTQEKLSVEEYCRRNRIDFEWKGGDRLRTRQLRSFVARHPRTGETVWFNHAAFFHTSALEKEVRDVLLKEFGEEDLPYSTCFGDGSPIEPAVVEEILNAYRREAVAIPWEKGDVMLVDNMLVAHGREPFTGTRRVLVGMTELRGWDDI